MDKTVTEQIAELRYKHYEEKRKGKIRLIEGTIKHGVLASFKETFPTIPNNQMSTLQANNLRRMANSVGAGASRQKNVSFLYTDFCSRAKHSTRRELLLNNLISFSESRLMQSLFLIGNLPSSFSKMS